MTRAKANGIEIEYETAGDKGDPVLLLVMGLGAQLTIWPDAFFHSLAKRGFFVIRYDNRDTGRSVRYPLTKPEYGMPDLVADAVGVLDALGVDRAHVVGQSMGGAIAQLVALERPDRLASLTLVSTTAGGDDLPGTTAELGEHYRVTAAPDWTDRAAVVEHLVEEFRALAGSLPFDEDEIRATAGHDFDRTGDIAVALTNHGHVKVTGEPWRTRLGEITAPTLVLHGTEDPLFPLPHGEMLAREIPDARLVAMAGAGHELPRAVWDAVIPELVKHTSQPRDAR